MKTLTYDEAFTLVSEAHAVRVDDSELLYPDCDEDDAVITLNSEHNSMAINISEHNNKTVNTNDGELVFKDSDGNDVTIMLLIPKLIK